MSFDRLQEAIIAKKNPTVAGLDPKPEYVPARIRKECYDKYGEEAYSGGPDGGAPFPRRVPGEAPAGAGGRYLRGNVARPGGICLLRGGLRLTGAVPLGEEPCSVFIHEAYPLR